MTNKNTIISDDIFSYQEYKNKKQNAAKMGKTFFNNYPAKKLNDIKIHSIFNKNGQIAQINIDYLNLNLDSLLVPDSNPFIWHLYKAINNYIKVNDMNQLINNKLSLLVYLVYIYAQNSKIPKPDFDRIMNLKFIPYNPSAQFLVSNKIILENKLYVYQNIHNVLLDPVQPILPQKVRLNGFIIEFLWLIIFKFDIYYNNSFSKKEYQFYTKKNKHNLYIKYYRKLASQILHSNLQPSIILNYNKDIIKKAYQLSKIMKYISNFSIDKRIELIIRENNNMLQSSKYNYYKKIEIT